MKILSVLLNPTIDQIYTINNFYVGGTFKIIDSIIYPVGKAISFSLGVRELCEGSQIKLISLIGEEDIPLYSQFLKTKKINYEFVVIKGKTRSNKTIIDPIRNTTTHIREIGFKVNDNKIRNFIDLVSANIENKDFIILSGSIPPHVENDIYFKLINICKEKGVSVILDTSGEPLINGIKANPTIIKVNFLEFSQILNDPNLNRIDFSDIFDSCKIIIKKAQQLLNQEVKIILITLADKGAILVKKDLALYGNVKINKVIDTVGSGDSFLAGFVTKFVENKQILDCFRQALACGAANTLFSGPGIFRGSDVEKILNKVELFTLN